MSNATGISFSDIMGLNMVPEIIKAECSMIGAYSNATKNSQGG